MTKITIDLPKDLEFMKNVPSVVLTAAVIEMLKEKAERIKELKRLSRMKEFIDENSELTEKDVEELTNKINDNISERHSE
jgi:hypothetical protein